MLLPLSGAGRTEELTSKGMSEQLLWHQIGVFLQVGFEAFALGLGFPVLVTARAGLFPLVHFYSLFWWVSKRLRLAQTASRVVPTKRAQEGPAAGR